MVIYLTNIFFIILYSLIVNPAKYIKKRKIFLIIVFIQLVLIYSLRSYNVGWDSFNYKSAFDYSKSVAFTELSSYWMEWGYMLINKVASLLCGNYIFLWFVISLILFVPLYNLFSKYSDNIFFSFFLYIGLGFFYNNMNQIRTSIATAICTLAFSQYINNNKIKAVIIVIIASSFHTSAVFFLFFLAMCEIFKDMKTVSTIKFVLLSGIIFAFKNLLIGLMTTFFYSDYFEENHLIQHTSEGAFRIFVVFFAIFIICVFLRKNYIRNCLFNNSSINKLANKKKIVVFDRMLFAVGVSCLIYALSSDVKMIARFAPYFSLYACILIPNAMGSIRNKNIRILGVLIITLLIGIYSYIYLVVSGDGYGHEKVLPYEFFWNAEQI